MKKLGIIGGLGPMGTAHFMTLLTQMTDAEKDQDHIEILLHSCPAIPDRTDFIIGKSTLSPEKDLLSLSRKLRKAGAEILAIPCFTAHYFHDVILKAAKIPVINAITETAVHLKMAGIKTAGIMATDGMIFSQLYQDEFNKVGIDAILPEREGQRKVMELIYGEIKSGRVVDMMKFHMVSQQLFENGAEVILLGCSELSLLKCNNPLPAGYLDVLEVLARQAVLDCGKLRNGYMNLIT